MTYSTQHQTTRNTIEDSSTDTTQVSSTQDDNPSVLSDGNNAQNTHDDVTTTEQASVTLATLKVNDERIIRTGNSVVPPLDTHDIQEHVLDVRLINNREGDEDGRVEYSGMID